MSTKLFVKNSVTIPALESVRSAARQSDDYWLWGGDNMLPEALALLSRRATTHRRIINDKADYISGKGFAFDENNAALQYITSQANGSGESLRNVMNRVAFDKALFGNAFLEVVTDASHSFLSFYHQDASKCRIARDSKHVILHHDWRHYKASEASQLPIYPLFEEYADGTLRSISHYKDYEPMFSHY